MTSTIQRFALAWGGSVKALQSAVGRTAKTRLTARNGLNGTQIARADWTLDPGATRVLEDLIQRFEWTPPPIPQRESTPPALEIVIRL